MEHAVADTGEVVYSEPGVVVNVTEASVSMAQIVEADEKTYLTTFGTAYGIPRHVEGAKRWTPLEIATAVSDALWESPDGKVEASLRHDYELAVNALLRSLTERSKQSPWRYPVDRA